MANTFTVTLTATLTALVAIEKISGVEIESTTRINPDMPMVAKDEHVKKSFRRAEGELTGRQLALNEIEKGPRTTANVRDAFEHHGKPRPSVDAALNHLKIRGKIVQGKDGMWRLAE